MVKLQDDPIVPENNTSENCGGKKKRSNKPVKYKRLQGRHQEVDDNEDRIEQVYDEDVDDQVRENNYMKKLKDRLRRNEANAKKLHVMQYENPFEAVAASKDMFKQKNLDYNLFVNDDLMDEFNKMELKDMSGKVRITAVPLAPDLTDADTEEDEPPPVASDLQSKCVEKIAEVPMAANVLPVVKILQSPAAITEVKTPAKVSALPLERMSESNLPTPRASLPQLCTPVQPTALVSQVIDDVPVVNKGFPVSIGFSNVVPEPASVVFGEPSALSKLEDKAPDVIKKDPVSDFDSRNKVAGKIGDRNEDVKYEKLYIKPAHPRKKIGYTFQSDDGINWQPGVNVHKQNVPPVEEFVKDKSVPVNSNSKDDKSKYRKQVFDIHEPKIPLGKRFNIITGTYE